MADTIISERSPKLIIEVCVDSVESAVAAVRGGANRLELCGNLGYGGGTTPSIGLLQSVRRVAPNVPIVVMIRPRTGDFVYSEGEMSVMLQDIYAFKEHGVQGVVFGVLTAAGDVDESQVEKLISAALPLEVCFHRAFDMANNLENGTPWHLKALSALTPQSLENIIQDDWNHKDIDKVISSVEGVRSPGDSMYSVASGHCRHASAPEALEALAWMFDAASVTSIEILPGSGINIATISTVYETLLSHGLREIHLSGGRWVDGRSGYRPSGMEMGEWSVWRTDEEAVRKVRRFVDGG